MTAKRMPYHISDDIRDVMKVAAELVNLYVLLKAVRVFAKKQGVDSKKIHQIELAVEEIVVNIIHYAYPPDSPGDIEIHCGFEEEKKLIIEIIDWGIPFDPLSVPEPDTETDLEDRDIGGLGIFFVRKLMDEVYYRREAGKNVLTLVMYLFSGKELL